MQSQNYLTADKTSSPRNFFKALNESKSSVSPGLSPKNNIFNLLMGSSTKNWKNGNRRLSDFCQINKVS